MTRATRTHLICGAALGVLAACHTPAADVAANGSGGQANGSGAAAQTAAGPQGAALQNTPDPTTPVVRGSLAMAPGTLGPAMADQYFTGSASGTMPASNFGEGCVGWVPAAPSHVVTVNAPMRGLMEITRGLNSDMVLVVEGDGGVFCDDDSGAELQPRVEPTLTPGEYRVYVGTWDQGGAGAYTLRVGEAAGALQRPSCDTDDAVVIDSRFTRVERSGYAAGERMCSSAFLAAECLGYFGGGSGHCLRVTETSRVVVDVTEAPFDSVVALRRAGEPTVTINDDRAGDDLRSRLAMTLEPGDYELYVGALDPGRGGDYTVDVMLGPEPQPTTNTGACIPVEVGRPVRIDGRLAGILPCADRFGYACDGYVSDAPNLCIRVDRASAARFAIVSSDTDTLLHVRGPGLAATDDNGGTYPLSAITASVTPGDYEVFVGSYDARITGPFVLEVERYY